MKIAIFLIFGFFVLNTLIGGTSKSSLAVSNMQQGGEALSFTYQNQNDSTGEVVFWLEYDGNPYCETKLELLPSERDSIEIECESMFKRIGAGETYRLRYKTTMSFQQQE